MTKTLKSSGIALMHPQVLSVKCYESQIVRQTIKICPTDNLKLSEENRQRDNSLQPVVSKSGCETTNKVLSLKCYERQIVRRTIKNCLTDNSKLSVGQKDKALSVKCYERQIVRRTIIHCSICSRSNCTKSHHALSFKMHGTPLAGLSAVYHKPYIQKRHVSG